jgi:hypothetical protein
MIPRPFLVCIHDASPAFTRETRALLGELAPLVGRSISFGVVPDWHGEWPLSAHPDFCRLIRESSDELLLHGYHHRRARGGGPVTWLTGGADEMNGLGPVETACVLERGQRVFAAAFGGPARGFVAPGWQRGLVRPEEGSAPPLDHLLGFFSLEGDGRRIPLATWSWHCGRWAWLGHVGHGVGRLLGTLDRCVPSLALHPLDREMGFWPRILGLVRELLDAGYEPTTPARLLGVRDADDAGEDASSSSRGRHEAEAEAETGG